MVLAGPAEVKGEVKTQTALGYSYPFPNWPWMVCESGIPAPLTQVYEDLQKEARFDGRTAATHSTALPQARPLVRLSLMLVWGWGGTCIIATYS